MPTNGIISRLKAAVSGFRFPSTVTHAGTGSFLSIAPRTFPYWNTDPLSNSAVVNVLDWITRNFGQAELTVTRDTADGEDEIIDGHPLVKLLERPNPYYGGYTLWSGVLTSYFLDGNAYILKERNARGFGVPTALWYEPHWSIRPHWPDDGSEFIDYYERRINGAIQKIPKENVIHFRKGLNPSSPRYGLSPLKAALLQVFTDNEVSMWVAALARNMAIPGVVVSPTENIGMSPEKAEQIKQVWKRKFGGDNRGEPLILDFQATVEVLGFDPKQMDFASINHLAETRIAGAFGIPAIVAGLGAGLDASTYNNLENLKKSAFEECLVPTWEAFEDELDTQLLPDFERDPEARGIETEFDTSGVKALRENQTELEKRAITAFQAGVITLNETRRQLSYDLDPDGDFYLLPNNARPIVASVAMARAEQEIVDPVPAQIPGQGPDQPPANEPKRLPAFFLKSFDWQGMTLRREPTEIEARCIKAIDEAMKSGASALLGQLLNLRETYIREIIDEIEGMEPETWHEATVTTTDSQRAAIVTILAAIFLRGAQLIAQELRQQGATVEGGVTKPDLDTLTSIAGVLVVRIANDVQARGTGAAIAGQLVGRAVAEAIRQAFEDGSTAYVARAANEGSNWAIAQGRDAEIRSRGGQIDYLVYSAVLDNNTCQPCGNADGLSGQIDDIPPAPNPDCEGGASCRCVHIPVVGNLEPFGNPEE